MTSSKRSTRAQLLGLAAWLVATFLTGAVGGLGSVNAQSFFADLTQPSWAPPAWLFGPVWTTLYILMALAAWQVWRHHGFHGARLALLLFIIQLIANAIWSWIFFAWGMGALALAEILILWALIAWTMWEFWRLDRMSAFLMAPYLLWVSFAAALTFALWRLNPVMLS